VTFRVKVIITLLAIFSLQQQFLYMQISYSIVTFCFFYMKFNAYHWLNLSCVPLYIPLVKAKKLSKKSSKKRRFRFGFHSSSVFVNFMRQNNNNPLIGNVLNEDHQIIVLNQKPKITNYLLIIINFAILPEPKI
jgi:hypothetical protein